MCRTNHITSLHKEFFQRFTDSSPTNNYYGIPSLSSRKLFHSFPVILHTCKLTKSVQKPNQPHPNSNQPTHSSSTAISNSECMQMTMRSLCVGVAAKRQNASISTQILSVLSLSTQSVPHPDCSIKSSLRPRGTELAWGKLEVVTKGWLRVWIVAFLGVRNGVNRFGMDFHEKHCHFRTIFL